MTGRTVILIPALNAAATLPALLDALLNSVSAEEILVVNDGSTDNTEEVVRKRQIQCVSLEKTGGKGAALRAGFRVLKNDQSIDSVVTMDADLQHDPEDLPMFLRCREETGSNIVLGSRKILGTSMPLHRRLSNVMTSFLVSARTGCSIRDSQCGFRLIGMEVLKAIETESAGYEAETELLLKACRLGFKVASVPIRTVYNGERSSMTHWDTTRKFVRTMMREF